MSGRSLFAGSLSAGWLLVLAWLPGFSAAAESRVVLIEAERFAHLGGWLPDSQFMDQMGSPFLLAHGLGEPVADARTPIHLPGPGKYRVWVRTRDWVATWNAPGAPGRFQLLVDGRPLETVFGTEGAAWHWQDGGTVEVDEAAIEIALRDLTGFEGRCDAIVFSADLDWTPPATEPELTRFRRAHSKLPEQPEDAGDFDLVVVGGGIAGTCAALSAARMGLTVAFIQDRPVLGGNNSSEVRVWLQGARNKAPYPRVGDIVRELEQARHAHYGPANTADLYEDEKKLAVVAAEPNIHLALCHRANGVEMDGQRIVAAVAQHTVTGQRRRFVGRWFVDATGDGCLGALAGADHELTLPGHMGRCNLWNVIETDHPAPFPRCPWALDLSDKPFPGRAKSFPGVQTDHRGIEALGGWYWESGFDHEPFEKSEYIRDWNFRAMYGAWDALKNVDGRYPNHRLNWAAHISGKRESRRLLGDVVLTKEDVLGGRSYPDGCVPTGWPIDLHLPDPRYDKGFEGDAFIAKAHYDRYPPPYWIPYRCLYSRNIANLFMAGRDISVTHEALGTVRVMRTGGCMGEVVGMAAAVCKQHDADPREVYPQHWEDLRSRLLTGAGKAPDPSAWLKPPEWLATAGENIALKAEIRVSGNSKPDTNQPALLNDGRIDVLDNDGRWLSHAQVPNWVELAWPEPQRISAARIISGYCQDEQIVEPIAAFAWQFWQDGQWHDIPAAAATENDAADWSARFPAITADRLRLLIQATHVNVARIWEIEVYRGE
ncbi:MAG: FAD-dependent oxidoreductase [Pirellulaceae bacterium]|nr:FAD-dependent oxidoreductase [Pirellulaceae bacterium]